MSLRFRQLSRLLKRWVCCIYFTFPSPSIRTVHLPFKWHSPQVLCQLVSASLHSFCSNLFPFLLFQRWPRLRSPRVCECLIFVTCFHFFHFVLGIVACLLFSHLAFRVVYSTLSRTLFPCTAHISGHICECMWSEWIYFYMQSASL